jgi:hypothetical protein
MKVNHKLIVLTAWRQDDIRSIPRMRVLREAIQHPFVDTSGVWTNTKSNLKESEPSFLISVRDGNVENVEYYRDLAAQADQAQILVVDLVDNHADFIDVVTGKVVSSGKWMRIDKSQLDSLTGYTATESGEYFTVI